MAVGGAPGRRGRRGRRPRTQAAVLEATMELLQTTSLADVTVAQILEAAEVGRTSFYEHFSSKEGVVVTLLRRVSAELGQEMAPMFQRGERAPAAAAREGLFNLVRATRRYAPLLAAVAEEWPAVPELRAIWLGVLGDVTDRLQRLIDEERAAGAAPPGADSRALAASLAWTIERSLHVALTGADATLREPEDVVEPLVQLVVGAVYGLPVAGGGSTDKTLRAGGESG